VNLSELYRHSLLIKTELQLTLFLNNISFQIQGFRSPNKPVSFNRDPTQ
jgi:hypothetical protein